MANTQSCAACGQSDTDPKHLVCVGDNVTAFHFDCHTNAEPPCASCAEQTRGAAGVTGGALREHLLRVRR